MGVGLVISAFQPGRRTRLRIAEAMNENIKKVGLPQWSEDDQKLAKALQKDAPYRPEIMLYPYPTAGRDAQQCKAAGILCINQFGRDFADRNQRRLGQIARKAGSRLK